MIFSRHKNEIRYRIVPVSHRQALLAFAICCVAASGATAQTVPSQVPATKALGEAAPPQASASRETLPKIEEEAGGQEAAPVDPPLPSPRELRDAAAKLSSPRFAERRKASRELRSRGKSAHPLLEQLGRDSDSESATRAIELLDEALDSKDTDVRQSAETALKRIADSDSPQADSARLHLRRNDKLPQVLNRLGIAPRPVLGPPKPAAPPAFAPQRPTNLRISIQNSHGVRKIKVVENGRTYQFKDDGNSIETERPDGKGGMKKQTYQNEQELQQADPEAHEAFRKAGGSGKRSRLRIQFGWRFSDPKVKPADPPKP